MELESELCGVRVACMLCVSKSGGHPSGLCTAVGTVILGTFSEENISTPNLRKHELERYCGHFGSTNEVYTTHRLGNMYGKAGEHHRKP